VKRGRLAAAHLSGDADRIERATGCAPGREHYRRAGEMLIEAKEQVGYGGWSHWLSKACAIV
jgi:hypothetical protein